MKGNSITSSQCPLFLQKWINEILQMNAWRFQDLSSELIKYPKANLVPFNLSPLSYWCKDLEQTCLLLVLMGKNRGLDLASQPACHTLVWTIMTLYPGLSPWVVKSSSIRFNQDRHQKWTIIQKPHVTNELDIDPRIIHIAATWRSLSREP